MNLRQYFIVSFCFFHFLVVLACQIPPFNPDDLGDEWAAPQMSFAFPAIKKLKAWRYEDSSFVRDVIDGYASLIWAGDPTYYFSLGMPKKYLIYAIEPSDESGRPLAPPIFSTCTLSWNECLEGKNPQESKRLLIMEHIFANEKSLSPMTPQYWLLKYGQSKAKNVALAAYEQNLEPGFFTPVGRLERRLIYVSK